MCRKDSSRRCSESISVGGRAGSGECAYCAEWARPYLQQAPEVNELALALGLPDELESRDRLKERCELVLLVHVVPNLVVHAGDAPRKQVCKLEQQRVIGHGSDDGIDLNLVPEVLAASLGQTPLQFREVQGVGAR